MIYSLLYIELQMIIFVMGQIISFSVGQGHCI